MRDLLGFYFRVLRRVPGVFMGVAGVVGSLALILAAVVLVVFSDKKLAMSVLSFQGFSPYWAIIPIGLLLTYGLANANYEEAKRLGATNRIADPTAPTQVIAKRGSHVTVITTNVIRPPDPPGSGSPRAGTEPEGG